MNRDQIRESLAEKVSETVQVGIHAIKTLGGKPDEFVNLGCNTALCSLLPILPFLSNKNLQSPEDVAEAMNYETLLFAALVVVKMHGDLRIVNKNARSESGEEGVAIEQNVQFGPTIMNDALEDWKVLTKKDPAKYFSESLLEALAHAQRESSAPFDEFMKKRINGPTSSTLN